MPFFRIEKNKNYTVMSNYHLREKNMSLKAKGLLSLMLSLPDGWDFSINGLISICKEERTAIRAILKELEQFHYLVRTSERDSKGRFKYIYNIFELPQNPDVENLYTDNLYADNVLQLNTEQSSTEQSSTFNNERKKDKTSEEQKTNKKENNSYEEIISNFIDDEVIKEAIYDFIKMRKLIKAPLTDRALKSILKKLERFTKDKCIQIQILEQSIRNNWRDIFPLREDKQNKVKNKEDGFSEMLNEILN